MASFDSSFNKNKKMLREMIEYNAKMIEKEEGRSKVDAEYLAICAYLEDLATRSNGQKGHKIIMRMLQNEYSQHYGDVVNYLKMQQGEIVEKEVEEKINKRQELDTKTAELYESAITNLKERWLEYNELFIFKKEVPLSDVVFSYSQVVIIPFKKKYTSLNHGTLFLELLLVAIIDSGTHPRMQIESARDKIFLQVLKSGILI